LLTVKFVNDILFLLFAKFSASKQICCKSIWVVCEQICFKSIWVVLKHICSKSAKTHSLKGEKIMIKSLFNEKDFCYCPVSIVEDTDLDAMSKFIYCYVKYLYSVPYYFGVINIDYMAMFTFRKVNVDTNKKNRLKAKLKDLIDQRYIKAESISSNLYKIDEKSFENDKRKLSFKIYMTDIEKILNCSYRNKFQLIEIYMQLQRTINFKSLIGYTSAEVFCYKYNHNYKTISNNRKLLKELGIIYFKKQKGIYYYTNIRDKDKIKTIVTDDTSSSTPSESSEKSSPHKLDYDEIGMTEEEIEALFE